MSKKKYIAGYLNSEDWVIAEATTENERKYSNITIDEYDSFFKAKQSLVKFLRDKIESDRELLKTIKSLKKNEAN